MPAGITKRRERSSDEVFWACGSAGTNVLGLPRTCVPLTRSGTPRRLVSMSLYHALLGRRVEVQYRAGDVVLTATGTLAADSGKSIFLEEKLVQRGQVKAFRWEIPYSYILGLDENFAPAPVVPSEGPEKAKAAGNSRFGALRGQIREA